MVCDRCGETFEYPEFSISERTQRVENNSICRCITKKNRKIFIYSDDPFFLCPSCMAKLNDWLKGEQERQAKWICDHESNSIECDKCRAEYKLSPYERESDFNYCPNCGSRMEEIKERVLSLSATGAVRFLIGKCLT